MHYSVFHLFTSLLGKTKNLNYSRWNGLDGDLENLEGVVVLEGVVLLERSGRCSICIVTSFSLSSATENDHIGA